MPRSRLLMLLVPVLLFALACQAITRPLTDVKDAAGTAESMATMVIEMSTQVAPTFIMPTDLSPAISTPEMSDGTPVPGNIFDPQGVPVATWREIPIMPQAIAGQEVEGMYSFRVDASAKEVQDFYEKVLPSLGWTGIFLDQDMLIGVYTRENQALTITVTQQEGGTVVLLAAG